MTCAYGLLPGKKNCIMRNFSKPLLMCVRGVAAPQTRSAFTWTLSWRHIKLYKVFGSLVKVKGCFYHLTQATFRKIQELGLVGLYHEKDYIKQFCGMRDSLAFVPVKDLPQAIKFLKDTCPPELEDLSDYFNTTYVSGS